MWLKIQLDNTSTAGQVGVIRKIVLLETRIN